MLKITLPFSLWKILLYGIGIFAVLYGAVEVTRNSKSNSIYKRAISRLDKMIELNEARWNSPAESMRKRVDRSGTTLYENREDGFAESGANDFSYSFYPRVQLSPKGEKSFSLVFESDKGYLDTIRITFSSGVKREFSVKGTFKPIPRYGSYIPISPSEYFLYFIADAPVDAEVSIPGFRIGRKTRIEFNQSQQALFRNMESFLRINGDRQEAFAIAGDRRAPAWYGLIMGGVPSIIEHGLQRPPSIDVNYLTGAGLVSGTGNETTDLKLEAPSLDKQILSFLYTNRNSSLIEAYVYSVEILLYDQSNRLLERKYQVLNSYPYRYKGLEFPCASFPVYIDLGAVAEKARRIVLQHTSAFSNSNHNAYLHDLQGN